MDALFILKIELTSKDIDDIPQTRLYCFDNLNKVSTKIEQLKKKYFILNTIIYGLACDKKLEHIFTLNESDILIN